MQGPIVLFLAVVKAGPGPANVPGTLRVGETLAGSEVPVTRFGLLVVKPRSTSPLNLIRSGLDDAARSTQVL